MTVLVNVFAAILLAVPVALAVAAWRRWSDPSISFQMAVRKLDKQIHKAVDKGEASRAHRLAQAWTLLMRTKDPSVEPYKIPELRGLYDEMPDPTEIEVEVERRVREAMAEKAKESGSTSKIPEHLRQRAEEARRKAEGGSTG